MCQQDASGSRGTYRARIVSRTKRDDANSLASMIDDGCTRARFRETGFHVTPFSCFDGEASADFFLEHYGVCAFERTENNRDSTADIWQGRRTRRKKR